MSRNSTRQESRIARHARVRRKVVGIVGRPRLSVFRSLKQIYGQLIDDTSGRTMASASSLQLTNSDTVTKTEVAKQVGSEIARRAKEAGITKVVFDRGGYKFHGRVKALADAAREGGLEF